MWVGLSSGVEETVRGGAVSSVLSAAPCASTVKALEVGMSPVGKMVGMVAWLTKLHPLVISNARQRNIKFTRRDGIKSA